MIYILSKLVLSDDNVCGNVFRVCPYTGFNDTWTLPIPMGKPPVEPYVKPQVYV